MPVMGARMIAIIPAPSKIRQTRQDGIKLIK